MTSDFTNAEKLAAIKRELAYRRYVYAKRVESKRMSRHKADHEIAIMEAIAADYEALVKAEPAREPRLAL